MSPYIGVGEENRPVLTLMTTEVFNGDYKRHFQLRWQLRSFINFSLVHDDIMDDAPLRHGNTTVHEKILILGFYLVMQCLF
jgi:geranylgeranyl diphosphate synthase type II